MTNLVQTTALTLYGYRGAMCIKIEGVTLVVYKQPFQPQVIRATYTFFPQKYSQPC